ncbi:MAG: hypothetical protein AB7V06_24830 [Candidatus Obscuribacterales bacterium]
MSNLIVSSLPIKARSRSARGNFSAELPPVLFLLFFFFVFPMINMGTIALRYCLLAEACRDGAHTAATSYTFETGSPGKPSALEGVPPVVSEFASRYSGIDVTGIDVDILVTDIDTQQVTRYTGKLQQPANTQNNLYALETIVTGNLEPLLDYQGPVFFNIPGLTSPWSVTVRSREFAESPQGLNQ